ncbi:MAG: hypothetical protein JW891_11635 [Candidatus Lokiarchaeota archaeon]|nr:hypothetical protein [Candidatus Lokiarchaeota archaeon]
MNDSTDRLNKYKKYNSLLTGLLIASFLSFSFLELILLGSFILFIVQVSLVAPLIYLLAYIEHERHLSNNKENIATYLVNTISLITGIIFGLLGFLPFNVQIVIFCIFMLFSFEGFVRIGFFRKETIIWFQDILAMIVYLLITYSFGYPAIESAILNTFHSQILETATIILVNGMIISGMFLLSFYLLSIRKAWKNEARVFHLLITINFLILETFAFVYINLWFYYSYQITAFLNSLVLSIVFFPTILLLFLFLNWTIKIFSYDRFKIYFYNALWFQVFTVLGLIEVILINDIQGILFWIMLDVLLFFIVLNFILKLGNSLGKINNMTKSTFKTIFSIVLVFEFLVLSFLLLSQIVLIKILAPIDNIIVSSYIALIFMTTLANALSIEEKLFSNIVSRILTITSLILLPFIVSWYVALSLISFALIYILPPILFCLLLYLPLIYMIYFGFGTRTATYTFFLDSLLLWIFVGLSPIVLNFENPILSQVDVLNLTLLCVSFSTIYLRLTCKKLNILDIFTRLLPKILMVVLFVFSGTFLFYYSFLILRSFQIAFLLSFINSSLYLFVPMYISYKYDIFQRFWMKYVIFLNSIALYVFIVFLPIFIGLDIGVRVTSVAIVTPTLVLAFTLLIFLEKVAKKVEFGDKTVLNLKIAQIPVWIVISIIITFSVAYNSFQFDISTSVLVSGTILIFFGLSVFTCYLLYLVEKKLSRDQPNTRLLIKTREIYTIFRTIIYYGIVVSLSVLISSALEILLQNSPIASEFPSLFFAVNALITTFIIFVVLITTDRLIQVTFPRIKAWVASISWLSLKMFLIVFILVIPSGYLYYINILSAFITFAFLTPITLYHVEKINKLSDKRVIFLKKTNHLIFLIATFTFYIVLFLFITLQVNYFATNLVVLGLLFACNLFLLFNYILKKYKKNQERQTLSEVYKIYVSFVLLSASLLYIAPIFCIVIFIVGAVIILSDRSPNFINKALIYAILSICANILVFSLLDIFSIFSSVSAIPLGFYIILYLLCLILTIAFSVILNLEGNNNFELLALYGSCAIWSFFYIATYFSNILLLYNMTISLLEFLILMGVTLFRRKDERYRFFIRPSILLFIFDLISYLSYGFFFVNPIYKEINPLLTLTLTISITDLAFICIYRDLKDNARRRSFSLALGSLIVAFPAFIGLFLVSYSIAPIEWPLAVTIALNILVFLYFLSVGVYRWKLSRAIWDSAWWAWNLLPIINVFMIYQALSGIDVITNALQVGGTQITGSLILTLIIFSLLYLPVLYTKIKKHFYTCLIFIWTESLVLIIWITFNIFFEYPGLIVLSSSIMAIILLMPLLYKLNYWRFVSTFWWILTIINASFFIILLIVNGVELAISISTGIILASIFFMIYSYFPNIKHKILYIACSYTILIAGIFSLLSFIIYFIFYNLLISINISSIIIAFSLFTSKYLKFEKLDPKRYIHLFISTLLIWHFSWLTYNTFSLVKGLELFSIFLAIAVLGGTLFVFSYYDMLIIEINKKIPWLTMTVGTSFAVISLCFTVIPSFWINLAIFVLVNIVFAYFWFGRYKYLLWYAFPVPFALLIQESMLMILIVRPYWALSLSITYLIIFQIFVNVFNQIRRDKLSNGLMKFFGDQKHVKLNNIACFSSYAALIPLFTFLVVPFSLEYRILTFLITLSFLLILTLGYINKSWTRLEIGTLSMVKYKSKLEFIVYLMLYIELAVLTLFIGMNTLGALTSSLISALILFALVSLDSSTIKRVNHPIINLISFTLLYALFPFALVGIFVQYKLLNIGSSAIIVLLETVFTYYAFYYVHKLVGSEKTEKIKKIAGSSIALLLYVELSISIFGYLMLIQELMISLLVSSMSLHGFVILDILLIKRVKNRIFPLISFSFVYVITPITLILLFDQYHLINIASISLIVLLETFFTYYELHLIFKITQIERTKQFRRFLKNLVIFAIYIEITVILFGLYISIFETVVSYLISLVVLILILGAHISFAGKKALMKLYYPALVISYFNATVLILALIALLSQVNSIFLNISILVFLVLQLITNQLVYLFRVKISRSDSMKQEVDNGILTARMKGFKILGGLIYLWSSICVAHGLILINLDVSLIVLIECIIIHALMKVDLHGLKLLGTEANYLEVGSWAGLMVFSWIYLLQAFFILGQLILAIPLAIFIFVLEVFYFFYLLEFLSFIKEKKEKIQHFLVLILYGNFVSWPIYFVSNDMILNLNLVLGSLGVLFAVALFDASFKAFKESLRLTLIKTSFLLIGLILSIDLFFYLQIAVQPQVSNFSFGTNLSLAVLLFWVFLGCVVLPLKLSHFHAFLYWIVLSASSSLAILFGLYMNPADFLESITVGGLIFLIFICAFPFIFMFEELVEFFSKLWDIILAKLRALKKAILHFFKKIGRFFKKLYLAIISFLKKNFKYIYLIFNIFVFILIIYLGMTYLNLAWYHAMLIGFLVISILLYFISPARTEEDPVKQFKWKLGTYFAVWLSVTTLIAVYITYAPKISDIISTLTVVLVFLTSSVILGAIILIDIYRREKAGKISIKWRYYTTLFFILLLIGAIVTGVFLGINFVEVVID